MRLLKRSSDDDFELIFVNDDNPPPYAILSHTWITTPTESHEVTYNELVAGIRKDKAGYEKIRFCSERAAADNLTYFWVDTCCIDKSTSDELSAAINSMFRWYQGATKCYVYLSDVSMADEVTDAEASQTTWEEAFRRSRWFTRGWTLQELIAPVSVEFFTKEGKALGTRKSLEQVIHDITKIPIGVFRGQSLAEFGVEERMNWVAERTTTMKEDKVYCLLGLFGVFLPLIYGEGEKYAKVRLREEIQKRQDGLGSERLHVISASSLLPFPRNEFFIGRENQLQQLLGQDLLDPNHHKRMTLHGLGGCGKSAIALEFAYRALERDASLLVFWVPAFSQESFELAYREIGSYLRIPGISNNDADIIALVKETLSSGSLSNWLMIVDNADDLSIMFGTTNGGLASAQLSDCVPYSNQGTILFTTRSKDIAEELTPDSLLGLTDLSKAEARQLLAWRVTKQALLNGETAVDELLETLTYLPLAIVQAAAFINNNHITVSEYRSLFQHPGLEAELFRERFDDPNRYQDMDNTIATTWHISFNQLRKHHPLAAKYLSFMACIDRFNIPQSLLPPGGSTLQQIKAIGSLIGYAFITERQQIDKEPGGDRFFDMHRLVHMASTGWLNDQDEWATWMATAVARLEELIPTGKIMEKKEFWATYLSHAIYVSGLDDVEHVIRGSLLDRVAHCQARLGKYPAATVTYQQALSIRSECLGPEHPDTLTTMNGFALVYCHLGHSKDSVELNKRTLALRKKVLGPEHEDTLQSMNNLAVGLKNQGKYAEAETLFKQTLERQKAQFGLQNEGTLFSMSNLAELLAIQRRFKEAETLYNDTRSEQVKLFHKKHPTVLSIDYSLAKINERTMDDRGDEAKFMFRYLLERQEEVLGPDHPDTLATVHSLAALRARLGHIAEAETMFRRVLAQREIIFGEKHLATVTTMYALAHTLRDQQIWGESAKLLDRAAQGFYTCLGGDHPTYKKCSMEHIKTQGREDSENGPSCIDEPFVLPKTEPLLLPRGPVVDYNGHAFGNQEPWAPNLPPASGASVELTTVKTSRLARSLARLGNLLPSSDVSGEPSTGKESRLARSTARLGMKKLVR